MADNSHAHRKIRKRQTYPYGMSDAICRADVERDESRETLAYANVKPVQHATCVAMEGACLTDSDTTSER